MAIDRRYVARFMGGFGDNDDGTGEHPLVTLQMAEADIGPDGAGTPKGEIHEMVFDKPEELMAFIGQALEAAQQMFPNHFRVDKIKVDPPSTH